MIYHNYLQVNNNLILSGNTLLTNKKFLTWPGSVHTEDDVIALGGSIFTIPIGSGYTHEGLTIGQVQGTYDEAMNLIGLPGWTLAQDGSYWSAATPTSSKMDYCGFEFYHASTNFEPTTKNYQFGGSYSQQWVSCAHYQSQHSLGDYWTEYFSNTPYFVRSLNLITKHLFGTDINYVGIY